MESMASIFLQKTAKTLGYVIILSTLTESVVLMLFVTFEIMHSVFILSLCTLRPKDHNKESECIFTWLRNVLGVLCFLGIPEPVMKIDIIT